MKTAIIVFPGTNREGDMAEAIAQISGATPSLLWHKETEIGSPDLIVLPGGFSYGDYLRCGAMAAQSPVMREVIAAAKRGVRVLGVCNGFQILAEAGLVPGTLLRNSHLKFACKQVWLRAESASAPYAAALPKGSVIRVPIAHGEGNYFADDATMRGLNDNDQVAFRYCLADGSLSDEANPNGSREHIAGVLNREKTVLGMMPHPEDALFDRHATQDGVALFRGLIETLA